MTRKRHPGTGTALVLSEHEVARITGRTRPSDQARYLEEQGCPFRVNAAGQIIVSRVAAARWLAHLPPCEDGAPAGPKLHLLRGTP